MEDNKLKSPSLKRNGVMILALLCVLMMALSSIATPPISSDGSSSDDDGVGIVVDSRFIIHNDIRYRIDEDGYAHISNILIPFESTEMLTLVGHFTDDYGDYYEVVGIDEGAISTAVFDDIKLEDFPTGYEIRSPDSVSNAMPVKSLVENTGDGCYRLVGITKTNFTATDNSYAIDADITSIDYGTFGYCRNLKTIDTAAVEGRYVFENGALYTADKTELIQVLSESIYSEIPNTVTLVDIGAFWNVNKIASVSVTSSSIMFEPCSFVACDRLINVVFTKDVTSAIISEETFSRCSSLSNVDFNEAAVTFGFFDDSEETIYYEGGYLPVFFYCENMTSVTFGNNAVIYPGAFYNNDINLHKVIRNGGLYNLTFGREVIRERITFVDEVTFGNNATILQRGFKCSSVKNVTFGNNAVINEFAFVSSDSLTSVEFGNNPHIGANAFGCNDYDELNAQRASEYPCTALESVTFSESGDIYIDFQAFYGCYSLKELVIENTGSLYVGEGAFFSGVGSRVENKGLESIVINTKGTVTLEYMSFGRNLSLASVSFGNIKTLKICEGAFTRDRALSSLEFGSGEKYINYPSDTRHKLNGEGVGSFTGCESLKKVDFGSGTVIIGPALRDDSLSTTGGAFFGCTNLVDVISNGNITMEPYTFYSCASLKTVTLTGATTIRIGSNCFTGCIKLETVEFDADVIDIGAFAFSSEGGGDRSANSAEPTISDMPCINFKNVVFGDAEVLVGTGAFSYCKNLQSVEITNFVSIGSGAFNWCVGLKEVYLEAAENLVSKTYDNMLFGGIGPSAFQGCTLLETITLKDVTSIGEYAFAACKNVKKLVFVDDIFSPESGENFIAPSLSPYCFAFNDGAASRSYSVYSIGWAERVFRDSDAGGTYTEFDFHIQASGEIEETSVQWILDGDEGVLSFTGNDSMLLMSDFEEILVSSNIVKKIVFGDGIRFIYGYNLVSNAPGANSVEEITLGKDVEYIGVAAFSNFAKVKSITIPEKMMLIDDGAFFGDKGLKEIIFLGNDPAKNITFGANSFNLAGANRLEASRTTVDCTVYSNSTGNFLDRFGGPNVNFDYLSLEDLNKQPAQNNAMFIAVIVVAVVLILLCAGVFINNRLKR